MKMYNFVIPEKKLSTRQRKLVHILKTYFKRPPKKFVFTYKDMNLNMGPKIQIIKFTRGGEKVKAFRLFNQEINWDDSITVFVHKIGRGFEFLKSQMNSTAKKHKLNLNAVVTGKEHAITSADIMFNSLIRSYILNNERDIKSNSEVVDRYNKKGEEAKKKVSKLFLTIKKKVKLDPLIIKTINNFKAGSSVTHIIERSGIDKVVHKDFYDQLRIVRDAGLTANDYKHNLKYYLTQRKKFEARLVAPVKRKVIANVSLIESALKRNIFESVEFVKNGLNVIVGPIIAKPLRFYCGCGECSICSMDSSHGGFKNLSLYVGRVKIRFHKVKTGNCLGQPCRGVVFESLDYIENTWVHPHQYESNSCRSQCFGNLKTLLTDNIARHDMFGMIMMCKKLLESWNVGDSQPTFRNHASNILMVNGVHKNPQYLHSWINPNKKQDGKNGNNKQREMGREGRSRGTQSSLRPGAVISFDDTGGLGQGARLVQGSNIGGVRVRSSEDNPF